MASTSPPTILIAGATGYVGSRLVRALLARGHAVRCLVRNPERLAEQGIDGVEVVAGDVLDPQALADAMAGIDVAYYLVHLMGGGGDFENRDRQAAETFAAAAREANVRRIIYLGALADRAHDLSPHLRSRLEVGEILRGSGVPTIEFRASIVIGAGSLSFETMRALVERLPIMTTPRWVRTLCQPIFIDDVIAYLVAALDLPWDDTHVFEIGGADQVSYHDLMQAYGRRRGLRRLVIPVPVLTPYLSSLWLALVTPLRFRVGRRLIESLCAAPTVVRDPTAAETFDIRPCGVDEAIDRALRREDREFAEVHWSEKLTRLGRSQPYGGFRFGSRVVDSQTVRVHVRPQAAFRPIQRIGGDAEWYFAPSLWRFRGMIDRILGGPGLRLKRGPGARLWPGDEVDFWVAERIEPGCELQLRARWRLPGRAWLDFEATPDGSGCLLRQTAIFDPVGLFGLLYWYAVYPVHGWVFRGQLRQIGRRAALESRLEWHDERAVDDDL